MNLKNNILMMKKAGAVGLSAALLLGTLAGCAGAASSSSSAAQSSSVATTESQASVSVQANAASHRDSYEVNAKYLQEYFEINDLKDNATETEFAAALAKVAGAEEVDLSWLSKNEAVQYVDALQAVVQAAHFEELALSFPAEKTAAVLEKNDVKAEIAEEQKAYVACLLDMGLLNELTLGQEGLTKENMAEMLMAVANANGLGRNYLGYTDEGDIYAKLVNAREGFAFFENEKLESIGAQAVVNGISTGYNLRSSRYDANFLPELTLRYGHSTTIHASQMLGLLASEGIVAKVQLEPKTSIFEYLIEWGEVPPATPDYKVEQVSEELYLASSLEYDLMLEFSSKEDKEQFDKIVQEYAKKNDGNEEGKGLIFASWWQPLYVSEVEMGAGYEMIYDNVITDGEFSLHPYCLPENLETAQAGFKEIDSSVQVESTPLYCNEAFFRYLNGDYQ